MLLEDSGHFKSIDAPLHRIITGIGENLVLNKKVTARGEWYSHLPFGDPKKLRELKKETAGMTYEAAAKCVSGGIEDLPMEDAALNASCNVDYITRGVDPHGKKISHSHLVHRLTASLSWNRDRPQGTDTLITIIEAVAQEAKWHSQALNQEYAQ